jgi:acylphosphatase
MNASIERITEIAAELIINGTATIDNAIEIAIKIDTERCEKFIQAIKNGKCEQVNKMCKRVYNKLRN